MLNRNRKRGKRDDHEFGSNLCAERLRKISELSSNPHHLGLDMVVSRMLESKRIFKILRSHSGNSYY